MIRIDVIWGWSVVAVIVLGSLMIIGGLIQYIKSPSDEKKRRKASRLIITFLVAIPVLIVGLFVIDFLVIHPPLTGTIVVP